MSFVSIIEILYIQIRYIKIQIVFQGVEFVRSPRQATEGQSSKVSNKQQGAISFFFSSIEIFHIVGEDLGE